MRSISVTSYEINPDNQRKYQNNLASLTSKLDALQIEIEKQMLPFSSNLYATYSDTIQYFEKKYNLGKTSNRNSLSRSKAQYQ